MEIKNYGVSSQKLVTRPASFARMLVGGASFVEASAGMNNVQAQNSYTLPPQPDKSENHLFSPVTSVPVSAPGANHLNNYNYPDEQYSQPNEQPQTDFSIAETPLPPIDGFPMYFPGTPVIDNGFTPKQLADILDQQRAAYEALE